MLLTQRNSVVCFPYTLLPLGNLFLRIINFEKCQNFNLNRRFCDNIFEMEQIVSSRIRRSQHKCFKVAMQSLMFSVTPKDTLRPIYTDNFIAEYCSSVL